MKKVRSINIEEESWKNAKELAKEDNRSISNMLEQLIDKEKKARNELQGNIKKEN